MAAVSVLAGHAGWMAIGGLVAGSVAPVALDVVLMAAGGAWLVARPGLAPAIALAALGLGYAMLRGARASAARATLARTFE